MINIIFCFGILIFSTSQIIPQEKFLKERTPEWLIEMFFTQDPFPEKEKYYTGEMSSEVNSKSIGEELTNDAEISYNSFLNSENKKAYRVLLFVDSKSLEFYIYLTKLNDVWKIEAVRRFLFPKFIYDAKDSLSQLTYLEPKDSSLYNLLLLLTANDQDLRKYFSENKKIFEQLISYFNEENNQMIQKMMLQLNLNGIFRNDKYPGCVFVQIGSFEERELGFIYDTSNAFLPEISQLNFILVEEFSDGWYLYRFI